MSLLQLAAVATGVAAGAALAVVGARRILPAQQFTLPPDGCNARVDNTGLLFSSVAYRIDTGLTPHHNTNSGNYYRRLKVCAEDAVIHAPKSELKLTGGIRDPRTWLTRQEWRDWHSLSRAEQKAATEPPYPCYPDGTPVVPIRNKTLIMLGDGEYRWGNTSSRVSWRIHEDGTYVYDDNGDPTPSPFHKVADDSVPRM